MQLAPKFWDKGEAPIFVVVVVVVVVVTSPENAYKIRV